MFQKPPENFYTAEKRRRFTGRLIYGIVKSRKKSQKQGGERMSTRTIAKFRAEHEIWRKDLAKVLEVPEEELERLETAGKVPPEIAAKITEAYHLPPDYFTVDFEAEEVKAREAVNAANEKFQTYVRRIYDAEAQISSLEQSLRTYTALRDKFEGYVYSVRRLMSDAKSNTQLSSRIMGLIADVVSCDQEYEVAIETAFGGAGNGFVSTPPTSIIWKRLPARLWNSTGRSVFFTTSSGRPPATVNAAAAPWPTAASIRTIRQRRQSSEPKS